MSGLTATDWALVICGALLLAAFIPLALLALRLLDAYAKHRRGGH